MLFHIKTRRPTRWPSNASILKASSLSLVVVLLLVSGIEAIVKQQQQQRSDDLSPSSQQISNNGQSSAYQNHKSSAGSPSSVSSSSPSSSSPSLSSSQVNSASPSSPSQSSQSSVGSISSVPNSISSSSQQHSNIQQPSYSSSISMSSSSSSLPSSISQQQNNVGSQMSNSGNRLDQLSSYNSGYGQMQKSSQYGNLDNMAVAASNQDQSYQAAANSVNMALANSGIFGPSSASAYGSVPQASQSSPSQSSGISSTSSQSGSSSPQSLNPLHYFYYPAKDTNSGANSASSSSLASSVAAGSPSSKAGSGGMDMMSNAASNSYQSLAYPSYADQLNNALSSLSGSNPEAAASSQDPSYMPQPSMNSQTMDSNQMYNSNPNGLNLNNNNNNNNQNNLGPQQHQNGPHQMFNGDLSGYSSNINSQQSSPPQQMGSQQPQSSISFNGPSNNNVGGESQFMNSHLNPSSNHQQMNSYQGSNLYNQFGDLSTSNFGNNAGSLSSVASYMSPNQPIDHQMNSQNSQHDLFSNGNNMPFSNTANQQFAASQLSPAAVAPNSNIQPPQQSHSPSSSSSSSSAASSLFNAATSLFGQSNPSSNPSSGSATQNQGGSNSLFSGQHYLNSFLPQYSQYASSGQQLGAGGNDQISSSSSASSAVAPTTSGSSHRFGIKSFIIPMLAAAGLSLLIPTMSNIGTAVGRKKRSIEDRANAGNRQQQIAFDPFNGASQLAKEISIGEYMDKIERYYAIYKNAVENDDCLNRLICEFGDAVKDVTGKSAVVTVIEKLAPAWMTGKVHLFKEATLESKEGKEKCKKYVCNSNKHQQHH